MYELVKRITVCAPCYEGRCGDCLDILDTDPGSTRCRCETCVLSRIRSCRACAFGRHGQCDDDRCQCAKCYSPRQRTADDYRP